ncbi:MAG: hypothetical protein K0Q66_1123 [Chitinophagaceae bacterium]|jgi:hypothetical protein|nr:hypothetical protein [Chitinophagaceae bacterium]
MKAASVNEIKDQLKETSKTELIALCLRLARFKKENKELLDFLLFQAHDLEGYTTLVKGEMDELFNDVNTKGVYLAKKTLRKILRIANKYIRYTGSKTAEADILIHYLTRFRATGLPWQKTKVLRNIHDAQLKKITAAIDGMHEDLQYDYRKALEELSGE